ncbi:protein HEG homolog 1-like [Spea bombifrons]|uniref:protein HEG homolog 1-like n=1 Tax=Spea bombifrons TaxID=233779 RepID=UPI00234B12E9|nr:protein HEG homolog 1-like [Spea bombifrons]
MRDLFQVALRGADGYLSTAVTAVDPAGGHAVLLHYFSTLSPVTAQDLENELIHSSLLCSNSSCVFSTDSYHSMSLCDLEMCDPSSTVCLWRDGLVSCDCREGYYQFHAGDRSCTACPSGFRWKDDRCLRCPFGFSGFSCEEPFLLTVVIESCVSCVLLVLFFTLLHSYIRRKKPTKPSLMDSVIRGAPSDEHIIRLPRAQFSWRNNWEWEEPPVSQMASTRPDKDPVLEFPEIRLKTFGDSPRAVVSSPQRGSHNLAFISDN